MKRLTVLAAILLIGALAGGVALAQSGYDLFQKALAKERAEGKLEEAIQLYKRVAQEFASDRALAAKALLQMGQCYEKLGKSEARNAYERVLRDYADQPEAAEARTRLAALTPPKTTQPVARQVWAGPGVDSLGVPSADGRYLPITDWQTGDLGIRDLVAGETRRLTNKGSWMQSAEFALLPVLSPDGKQIAYAWFNKGQTWDLRIMGTDGSAPRVLDQGPDVEFVFPGGWTPDGKHIVAAIARKDKTSQIGFISAADGALRVLKTLSQWPAGASYKIGLSPDGRYIAYARAQKEGSRELDIFLLSVQTKQETPLAQHPALDFGPIWTPDGKNILFVSDRTGTLSLWLQQVVEGKPKGTPELLKPDVGRIYPMGFTQKGAFYYGLDAGMNDAYVATLDLTAAKVLDAPVPLSQRYVGLNSSPAWSPDGKYLAYLSRRGPLPTGLGSRVIVLRSVETGQERDIAVDLGTFVQPQWSPDSRSILVMGEDKHWRAGVFRIDAQSGEVTTLVQEEGNICQWPALSLDGKTLFCVQINIPKRTRTLVARDLQSGEKKELLSVIGPQPGIRTIALSPDGQQLAFVWTDEAKTVFKVMPATGGEARDICQFQRPVYTTLIWTPDGQRILFYVEGGRDPAKGQDQTETYELWQVSAAGGEPQKLGLAMERLRDISLHPDGKRLAFSAGRGKPEVWVMENFLPPLKVPK